MAEHHKPTLHDPVRRTRRNAENDRLWHPDVPAQSSQIKPMPALGCTGKYFRDEITRAHHGIDTTYEHSTSDGKGYASRCRIGKQT